MISEDPEMKKFQFQPMFPVTGADDTPYRKLTDGYVRPGAFDGRPVIRVEEQGLELLSEAAFTDVAFLYRTAHLEQLADILHDPESSGNDRFVAEEMLKNAAIAAEKMFPMCQDTGTAIVIGKKGQGVWTGGNDEAALAKGMFNAYTRNCLRYSQLAPLSMYEEVNTGCNLPAQVELYAASGDAYEFLFIAKGGGSANKTFLFQENRSVLDPTVLEMFLTNKMKAMGTAGCPPYHLAVVIGGTSAEAVLKTVKLLSSGYLDGLPTSGNVLGHAFRVPDLEKRLLDISRTIGIGAQFGGRHFCHDVRVVRMPRHGASCPIGIGISCSADRHIKGKITADGIFLEQLDENPSRFLPPSSEATATGVRIDLNRPMEAIREELSRFPVATRLLLNGDIVVARDIAHARLYERLKNEGDLPDYFKDHIIYYAGPAKTPEGYASGSFGPTTAGRMDGYVAEFQKHGGSLVMLAKGNRSGTVTEACKTYGGFYLGSIGGPAARLGRDCIMRSEVLAYPELGMEAIYRITVRDFPAFIMIDDKGNDFFNGLLTEA
jgi:fumarate hydratase, class I